MNSRNSKFRIAAIVLLAALAYLAVPTQTFASTTTGLPWESPLTTIKNSLTGPVAGIISLIAICVTGFMLIWGGEINEFAKKLCYVVLVISLITGAASLITLLFGGSAALM
jgi:type IV secretion system protein VirB2